LNVPAVLKAQGAKLFVSQLAFLPTLELVSVLGCSLLNKLAVEFCVLVHLCDWWVKALAKPNKGWTLRPLYVKSNYLFV
jgi:hypothetical protein